MGRILVTTNAEEFDLEGVTIVSSISDVAHITPETLLILHTYEEDEYTAGVRIADLINQGLSRLMYLTDDPKLNMYSLVASVGGLNETSAYLLDNETLEVLINETQDDEITTSDQGAGALVSTSSVDILKKFYYDYTSGEVDKTNTAYLQLVERAIDDIATSSNELAVYDKDVKETVNNLYMQAFNELDRLEGSKLEIETSLKEIQEMYEELKGQSTGLSKLESFAPYRHVKNTGTKLIVFKEYSQVRYLTTFILGYAEHLATIMHKRVRVLFIIPNKDTYLKKYRTVPANFFHLTGDNFNTEDALNNTVYYTEVPIVRMYKHLTTLNDDILIVVDRTYNYDFAVKGNVTQWHAFSGKSEADSYGKDVTNRIFSIKGITSRDVVISHIPKYENEPINRQAQYSKTFNKVYEGLDVINKVQLA